MRTKALLLAAAFAAAGVATSMAQVYSVNAVGYVNVTLKPGFNMVANPLDAADNTIASLFKNIQGTIPPGLKVYKFDAGGFKIATWDDTDLVFGGPGAGETVTPGNGVFVLNPSDPPVDLKLTFVGQVPQGDLVNPIPAGFSIKASQVPQEIKPEEKGLVGNPGDKIFRYDPVTKGYTIYTFDDVDLVWAAPGKPIGLPAFPVGEAFYYFGTKVGGTTWNRSFSVNNPT